MKYMGSKNRHAKELLPIILKDRKPDQWYVEPFVGGFNMIDKVTGNRIGNDSNMYLVELFRAIQRDWEPPSNVSEEEYNEIKEDQYSHPPYMVGFVGFGCSYSGKWFGGYARGNTANGTPRNYALESKKNILKQNVKGIIIQNKNYLDLEIPENSIIYCDPPYADTTKYKDDFDHAVFWDWVRKKHAEGHSVFVSEYTAPPDFKCVWEKSVNNTLDKDTGSKRGVERLFIVGDNLPEKPPARST